MADEITPGDEPPAEQPKYDQAFFLALAAKGKEAWNAWRRDPANEKVRVTFFGIDFSEAPRDEIDFSGFEFGDDANFSGCKWRGAELAEIQKHPKGFPQGLARFAGAVFGNKATFECATFGDYASFAGATFGDGVSFAGATFGGYASFGGADFGHAARFSDAAFDYGAEFDGTAFGNWASFSGAAFSGPADFSGATFGSEATFALATFGDFAQFDRADFGTLAIFTGAEFGMASFDGAAFGNSASFAGAALGDRTSFNGAAFGADASFDGVAFGGEASFDDAVFKGQVEFTGKSKEQWSRVLKADADEIGKDDWMARKQRHEDSWRTHDTGPDRFVTISFANRRFFDKADFSGRTFEQAADFTQARFYYPPEFDPTIKDARIDFTGTHIGFVPPRKLHCTYETKVPVQLRRLRKIAEETKNHDLERDLYIEERKAERGVYWHQLVEELKKAPEELKKKLKDIEEQQREVWSNSRHRARARSAHVLGIAVKIARLFTHLLWIVVMGVYWALADYGRSFIRPAVALGLSVWLFHFGYAAILAPLTPQAGTLDAAKYARAVGMVAIGNAVPFFGPLTIDAEIKKFLFCPSNAASCLPPIPPEGHQLLVLGQNLFSITCVFFIGLALRNYFRIK